jgi:hypothetical protein
MTPEKTLKSLPSSEMVLCQSCGQYHKIEDCEVVVIKMIKGKHCEMKPTAPATIPMFGMVETKPEEPKQEVVKQPPEPVVTREPGIKTRTIVPPGLAAMMIPPSHPQFEEKGAKERRYA